MNLSDDLVKGGTFSPFSLMIPTVDQTVETVIRKIQRAYADIKGSEKLLIEPSREMCLSASQNHADETPQHFIENFKWSIAKYPISATLMQLTSEVQKVRGHHRRCFPLHACQHVIMPLFSPVFFVST